MSTGIRCKQTPEMTSSEHPHSASISPRPKDCRYNRLKYTTRKEMVAYLRLATEAVVMSSIGEAAHPLG